jgi:CheY-like chemotaxis protein
VIKALEKLPNPDLILMDIGLAGSIDGIEIARKIWQYNNIPILFLTKHVNLIKIEEMKSISSCGYLGKPYLEKDLLTAIENTLHT